MGSLVSVVTSVKPAYSAVFPPKSAAMTADDGGNMAKYVVLKMIGKGFYSKWVKSSFEHFITTQTHVSSTKWTNNIAKYWNFEVLFFDISGNLRNLWRHLTASFMLDVPLVSSFSAFIQ